jgi:hypothetical protein
MLSLPLLAGWAACTHRSAVVGLALAVHGAKEMSTTDRAVDHGFKASLAVMRQEIAWFRTLDDDTLERIADTAPREAPEYQYANAELERRATLGRRGFSYRVSPPPTPS